MLYGENFVAGLAVEELSALDVFSFLHSGESAVITFHEKNPTFKDLGAIPSRDLGAKWPSLVRYLEGDFFFSINSVYEVRNTKAAAKETGLPLYQRRADRLRFLNAVYVDVDVHEQCDVCFETIAEDLLQEIQIRGLPYPGILVSSGRGAWLLWPLTDDRRAGSPVKAFPEKRDLYQRINRALAKVFASSGADSLSTDAARVMRVPGSVNCAAPECRSRVRFFMHSAERHTLTSLSEVLGVLPRRVEPVDRRLGPKDPEKVKAAHLRWRAPLEGVRNFLALRKSLRKGIRHNTVFVYSYLLSRNRHDREQILKEVARVTRMCDPSLPDIEVRKCIDSAIRTARHSFQFSIRNSRIAELLGITHEERLQLKPWSQAARDVRVAQTAERHQFILDELRPAEDAIQIRLPIPSRQMARILDEKYEISVSHTTILNDYKTLRCQDAICLKDTNKGAPWKAFPRHKSHPLSLYQQPKLSESSETTLNKIKNTLEDKMGNPDQKLQHHHSSFSEQPEPRNQKNDSDDDVMTPAEAAAYLRISIATLLRMARNGEIPGLRVGKLWRFRRSELDRWLRSDVSSFRHPCRERRETNDEFAATVPERVSDKKDSHPRK
jgi:excisionase family DNA binding protein